MSHGFSILALNYPSFYVRDYDTAIAFYTRVVWGMAHGDRVNSIVGAHDLGLHFMPMMSLFAPLSAIAPVPETLLVAHLRWMHENGLQPDKAVDAKQTIDDDVVVTEDALVAYLLAEAEAGDVDLLDDVDAVNVVEAHLAYFEAIGAVGPQAPLDDLL